MKKTDFNFDIKQLRSFLEVCSQNSFTRASRRLHIGQATISHHIQQLEEALGVSLIKRSSKEFSITDQGLVFKDFCERFFSNVDKLREALGKDVIAGTTEIAASTIPSTYIVPQVVASLKIREPAFFYRVLSADSREVVEMVKEGRMEIGILGKKYRHPNLDYNRVYSDTIVLIGPVDCPDRIDIRTMKTMPMIVRENGSGTRTAVEKVLAESDIRPSDLTVVFECASTEAIKEAVSTGIGISFVSKLAISKELELNKIKEIALDGVVIERDFYVVFQRNKTLSKAAQLFCDELKTMEQR